MRREFAKKLIVASTVMGLAGCAAGLQPRAPEPPHRMTTAELDEACDTGQSPAPDPSMYQNDDFEFAVALPSGLPACVGGCGSHSVLVLPDEAQNCSTPDRDQRRAIAFFASYTTVFTDLPKSARNVRTLAEEACSDHGDEQRPTEMRRLEHQRMGNRLAEGCEKRYPDGRIRVELRALRWIRPNTDAGIEIGAWLTTTLEHKAYDEALFRRMLNRVWIRRDGPQDFQQRWFKDHPQR